MPESPSSSGPHVVRLSGPVPPPRSVTEMFDEAAESSLESFEVVLGSRRAELPHEFVRAISQLLHAFQEHESVIITIGGEAEGAGTVDELTSQEAADLMNVSRPYVVKLARTGVLPHRMVGNRHRFHRADVLRLAEEARVTRHEALAELAPESGYDPEDF